VIGRSESCTEPVVALWAYPIAEPASAKTPMRRNQTSSCSRRRASRKCPQKPMPTTPMGAAFVHGFQPAILPESTWKPWRECSFHRRLPKASVFGSIQTRWHEVFDAIVREPRVKFALGARYFSIASRLYSAVPARVCRYESGTQLRGAEVSADLSGQSISRRGNYSRVDIARWNI
jgi:hypothetical protein